MGSIAEAIIIAVLSVFKILNNNRNTNWYLKAQLFQQKIPPSIMAWLVDEKSLTKRLISACSEQFSVKVLNQSWVKPSVSEQKLLSVRKGERVLLRQVILYCGESPVIFAHSLIPIDTLRGKHRRLGSLNNKPLGKYLFSKPYLKRSSLQWSLIKPNNALYHIIAENNSIHGNIWGRRSLFHLKQKKLLVSEYFLPAIHTI